MTGADKPKYYFDTNIFLDWLNRNQARNDSNAVFGLMQMVLRNEVDLITSQITRLEILECKTDDTAYRTWTRMQARRNVAIQPATSKVMDLTLEIRNYYQAQRDLGLIERRTISVPDAIHVATAIYYNVDEMFTFDAGRTDKKTLSPSDLASPIAGKYNLKISAPEGIDGALAV
jgi:predicted nucleic acid-binding protein